MSESLKKLKFALLSRPFSLAAMMLGMALLGAVGSMALPSRKSTPAVKENHAVAGEGRIQDDSELPAEKSHGSHEPNTHAEPTQTGRHDGDPSDHQTLQNLTRRCRSSIVESHMRSDDSTRTLISHDSAR